jgi:hypothetical protein
MIGDSAWPRFYFGEEKGARAVDHESPTFRVTRHSCPETNRRREKGGSFFSEELSSSVLLSPVFS